MLSARCLSFAMLFLGFQTVAWAAEGPLDGMDPVRTVVFEDNFESFSGQSTLERWEGVSPAWQVRESDIRGLIQEDTRPITRQVLFTDGSGWEDYSLLCRLRIVRWGGQTKNFAWSGEQYRRVYWAVALRVSDAANGYRLEYAPWVPEGRGLKQSYYRIVKYTGGQRTELARVISTFHSDLDYLVRFEARGKSLKARVWPAGTPEPQEWTIAAVDADHTGGTVSFLTANAAVLFGGVRVENAGGRRLLEEDFGSEQMPGAWQALSGSWRCAPWGRRLVRSRAAEGDILYPARRLPPLPAELSLRFKLDRGGYLCLVLHPLEKSSEENMSWAAKLKISTKGVELLNKNDMKFEGMDLRKFPILPGQEYSLRLSVEKFKLSLVIEQYPVASEKVFKTEFITPPWIQDEIIGLDPVRSQGVSLDDLTLEAVVPVEEALHEYLRYICDWYMSLELPTGYPKTGSGSPELFIAAYCIRTLMAGSEILHEPAYLEEALRWADFVCNSSSVLVPTVTGTGREALALRTFADWSSCINMADIGSVLLAVGVLTPWGNDQRRSRYLEVMEKYSLYVIEGCLEDPLTLGRGHRAQGWRIDSGPDKGGIINGYWWMDRNEEPWDVSTTNAGMQFYSVLSSLTGNREYRRYAREALDWYLRREIDTGNVFEDFHDVVYGGEALITAFEHVASEQQRTQVDRALGKLCTWIVENQNPDGTWNQQETPRNNRTNLVWTLLNWYAIEHPENKAVRQALQRTVAFHLDRANSRAAGVCEVLRKSCFTGVSVAELIRPGSTVRLRKP